MKRNNCIEEINITPLVDVFLVLLSIFVVLSMLYYNQQSNIVKSISVPKTTEQDKTISKKYDYTNVFIYKDMTISINKNKPMTFEGFKKEILTLKNKKINVIADENLKYKYIIKIMDIFKDNGIENIYIELSSI